MLFHRLLLAQMRHITGGEKKGGEKMKKSVFRTALTVVLCICLAVGASAAQLLVPVGKVVGLSLSQGSVTVVSFDETKDSPAKEAGLQSGDEIIRVDKTPIDSAADLRQALMRSDGTVRLTVSRNRREHELVVKPSVSDDGPRLGVYVREGVTGIGTVTYYDPENGTFGALGHGISDAQGKVAGMDRGSIYPARVVSVRPGLPGKPGQLQGEVSSLRPVGTLRTNCSFGVFGSCQRFAGEALPTGQARCGSAQILSNISDDGVQTFQVEISKVFEADEHPGRDLMLRITDPRLLSSTGGIVAGMSGSPIIQNGRIVGAVTHVLINDPTKGYGIFIENMLEAAENGVN